MLQVTIYQIVLPIFGKVPRIDAVASILGTWVLLKVLPDGRQPRINSTWPYRVGYNF